VQILAIVYWLLFKLHPDLSNLSDYSLNLNPKALIKSNLFINSLAVSIVKLHGLVQVISYLVTEVLGVKLTDEDYSVGEVGNLRIQDFLKIVEGVKFVRLVLLVV
jgi:hypothetical protein